jgi:hypothetical protein
MVRSKRPMHSSPRRAARVQLRKKSPAEAGLRGVYEGYCAGAGEGADGGVVAGAGAAVVGARGAKEGAGADVERCAAGVLFAAVRTLSLLYVTTK